MFFHVPLLYPSITLVLRPYIYERRRPGTHCLCMRQISMVTLRKMCYHGDPMHAQAVCARPSPLVYRAWERGYPPNSSHSCGVLQSYSVSSNTSRGRKEGKVGVGRPSAPCPSRALEVCSVTGIRSLLSPTPNVTSTHTHAHTE